jgi:protein-L-isoaspartate(D-aspartate) O-methyltransferase
VSPAEEEARRRNDQLVARLEESGVLREPAVAAAFRAVLRHRFLPGRPLDEVYEDRPITIKTGEHGVPISSSSQPAIMAIMLQLLRARPGHRVLEVGTGTGYNAAMLASLVSPGGRVVTLDIDPELAAGARANLAGAGVTGVEVVPGDGAEGWAPGAPYDRVIVTAGADDLLPAWRDQLVEEGRLVLPLALAGPGQMCVALVRRGALLASSGLCPCGFMPLRGEAAPAPPAADGQLAGWLAGPGRAAGQTVRGSDLRAGFELWLALTDDGYVSARLPGGEVTAFGLRDGHGAALVTGDGDHRPVVAFGDGDAAATRLGLAERAWARHQPALDRLRVAAYPRGEEPALERGGRVLRRPCFTFTVEAE